MTSPRKSRDPKTLRPATQLIHGGTLRSAFEETHNISSAVALAMLPVAQEYKKVLIVEPAVADAITGDKWNRYIFRTSRNSTQDALAAAVALGKGEISIATLAQDYAFGRE